MNTALESLARQLHLEDPVNERMRLEFGAACAARVQHLLQEAAVTECLAVLQAFLAGSMDRHRLDAAANEAARLANHHQGSNSIDGVGHAAVSSTYAVANALAGKALQAADYAAYARVYGQGGYGAVCDPESFASEHQWQVSRLAAIARAEAP